MQGITAASVAAPIGAACTSMPRASGRLEPDETGRATATLPLYDAHARPGTIQIQTYFDDWNQLRAPCSIHHYVPCLYLSTGTVSRIVQL